MHGWANFLTGGPQWVVKFDRGVGAAADEWSDPPNRRKKIYHGICKKQKKHALI